MSTEGLKKVVCAAIDAADRLLVNINDPSDYFNSIWSFDALCSGVPGAVRPADLDFILERNGRMLIGEFKDLSWEGEDIASLPTGQRLLLQKFLAMGHTVFLVRGDAKTENVETFTFHTRDWQLTVRDTDIFDLAECIGYWYTWANSQGVSPIGCLRKGEEFIPMELYDLEEISTEEEEVEPLRRVGVK